jgi:hypothetical protein
MEIYKQKFKTCFKQHLFFNIPFITNDSCKTIAAKTLLYLLFSVSFLSSLSLQFGYLYESNNICMYIKNGIKKIHCNFNSSEVAKEVLAEKVPSSFDCYMPLCEAVQMLYSKELQTTGWSEENISRLNNLLWKHATKAEEYYGLGFCTENLEYSVHAASDIRRHSSLDNYSCELYERAIRIHKQQKHNSKGLEKPLLYEKASEISLNAINRRMVPFQHMIR